MLLKPKHKKSVVGFKYVFVCIKGDAISSWLGGVQIGQTGLKASLNKVIREGLSYVFAYRVNWFRLMISAFTIRSADHLKY